jgi:hypothetical protein
VSDLEARWDALQAADRHLRLAYREAEAAAEAIPELRWLADSTAKAWRQVTQEINRMLAGAR